MFPRAFFAALVLLVATLPTASVKADDAAALKEAVNQLFEIGYTGSFKSRGEADAQFQAIQQISRGDVRAVYAYVLVQIKQHRYPEATQLLTHLVNYDKDNLQAWKTKAWLSMFTKEYGQSLIELDRICQMIPETDATVEDKIKNLETSQFLGRLIGYLEGPQEGAINTAQLESQKLKIVTRLGKDRTIVFDEARESVVKRFKELSTEQETTEEEAKELAEKEREQELSDLEKEKSQLDDRKNEIGPQAAKLEKEMRDELSSIAKEDEPLLQQLTVLDSQRLSVQREAAFYTSDIVQLQAQLGREQDPVRQSLIQDQINQRSILASRYNVQIRQIEGQMAGVAGRRVDVARRYQQTEASYRSQLQKLGVEVKEIEKKEKRNLGEQKKVSGTTTGDLRRARVLAAQAKALSTYQDLEFDIERQRLLESFVTD